MDNVTLNVREIIGEINRIHSEYSLDYFETGKVQKVNLSRTIANVPLAHIYNYRLNLHESINDYLMKSNIVMRYYYRVKTSESIKNKIERYETQDDQYPVNNWLNDIFGVRIILDDENIANVISQLDDWQEEFFLKNWYLRNKDGYKGLHIYFKNKSNFFFPWELQIWNEKDIDSNIRSHENHKRSFVMEVRRRTGDCGNVVSSGSRTELSDVSCHLDKDSRKET